MENMQNDVRVKRVKEVENRKHCRQYVGEPSKGKTSRNNTSDPLHFNSEATE